MSTKNLAIIIALLVVIGGVIFAVTRSSTDITKTSDRLRVTTSFYPLWFFTSQIAGDKADVTYLTPAGAEPHDYEPSPQDIVRLETSDLLVLNGGGLEAWSANVLQGLNPDSTRVVFAADGLTTERIEEEGEEIIDPHVWLSPKLAGEMSDRILQGLIAEDPDNADYYYNNASTLKQRLDALDKDYRDGLASCGLNDIITSHAAFGYIASTYGLVQRPITGLSPDAEPSPQELAALARFARENQVSHIFFESLVSPRLAETLAEEIGAQTLVLNPLEGLTVDEQEAGKDYFTEMQSNLLNLRTALACR